MVEAGTTAGSKSSFAVPEYSFSEMYKEIEEKGIRKIEDAIAILPQSLRDNYTLMYASNSIQHATKENPRAILFGHTADFIVTFNGEANPDRNDNGGYNSLETLEFRRKENRFILREIVFDPGGLARPRVSAENPGKCLRCHTHYAQPIWSAYNTWKGAYGELDDSISSRPPGDVWNPLPHPPSLSDLVAWKQNSKEHVRYKHLNIFADNTSAENQALPYYEAAYSGLTKSLESLGGRPFRKYNGTRTFGRMPNSRLAFLLAEKVGKVNANIIMKSVNYPLYRYGLAKRCLKMSERNQLIDDLFNPWALSAFNLSYLQLTLDFFSETSLRYNTGTSSLSIEEGICAEIFDDIYRSDRKVLGSIHISTAAPKVLDEYINNELYSADPRFTSYLDNFAKVRKNYVSTSFENYILTKSKAQTNDNTDSPIVKIGLYDQSQARLDEIDFYPLRALAQNRCIECHSSPRAEILGAPVIPFTSRSKLKSFARSNGQKWKEKLLRAIDPQNKSETAMPPDGMPLIDRDFLKQYFGHL